MPPATIGGSETGSPSSVNGAGVPVATSTDCTSPSELAIHRRLLASTGPVQKIGPVSFFGPVPAECELVDGLFIAARKEALREKGVRFDPQFDFHFYDLDFCRTVRAQGLRLGTWPIALTHQSTGALGSEAWRVKYEDYLEKWGS